MLTISVLLLLRLSFPGVPIIAPCRPILQGILYSQFPQAVSRHASTPPRLIYYNVFHLPCRCWYFAFFYLIVSVFSNLTLRYDTVTENIKLSTVIQDATRWGILFVRFDTCWSSNFKKYVFLFFPSLSLFLSLFLSLSIYLSRPPSLLQPCISIHYSLFRSRKPSIYINISNKSTCLIGKRDLRKRQCYNQVLAHSFMQSSQRRLQLEATPRDLHLALSVATWGSVSMARPLIFRSLRTVRLEVSFGLPLFLFPGVSEEEQPWAVSWGHVEDMAEPSFWMVSYIIDIPVLLSSSSY